MLFILVIILAFSAGRGNSESLYDKDDPILELDVDTFGPAIYGSVSLSSLYIFRATVVVFRRKRISSSFTHLGVAPVLDMLLLSKNSLSEFL